MAVSAREIQMLISARDQASAAIKAVGGSLGQLVATARQAESSLTQSFTRSRQAIDQMGASAQRMGGVATAGITAPMIAVGTAALKMASEVEDGVAKIQTIRPDFDASQLFGQINAIRTEVPKSAEEIADAIYNVVSSLDDIGQSDALDLSQVIVKGATAAGAQAEDFGAAIIGVINAYKMNVSDAGRISDLFFNTVNKGVITGQQLSRELGQVTQTAKNAGVEFELLTVLIAGITKEGGPASINVNNLNNFLAKVTTKDAQDAFKKIGVSVTDAEGDFRNMIDIVSDTKSAIENLPKGKQAEILQDIFPDLQARTGFMTLMSQLPFLRKELANIEQSAGATDKATQKIFATASVQVKTFLNILKSLGASFGASLLPGVTEALTTINSRLRSLAQGSQSIFANAPPGLIKFAQVLGLIAAAAGPAIALFGTLARALAFVVTPASLLAGVFAALAVAFAADVGGMRTAAEGLNLGGIIQGWLGAADQFLQRFGPSIDGALSKFPMLREAAGAVLGALTGVAQAGQFAILGNWAAAADSLRTALMSLTSAGGPAAAILKDLFVDRPTDFLRQAALAMTNIRDAAVEHGLVGAFASALAAMGTAAEGVSESLKSIGRSAGTSVGALESLGAAGKTAARVFLILSVGASDVVDKIFHIAAVIAVISAGMDKWGKAIDNLNFTGAAQALSEMYTEIETLQRGFYARQQQRSKELSEGLIALDNPTMAKALDSLRNYQVGFDDSLNTIQHVIDSRVPTLFSGLDTAAKNAAIQVANSLNQGLNFDVLSQLDQLQQGIANGLSQIDVMTPLDQIQQEMAQSIAAMGPAAQTEMQSVSQSMVQPLQQAPAEVSAALDTVAATIAPGLAPMSVAAQAAGTATVSALVDGVSQAAPLVDAQVSAIAAIPAQHAGEAAAGGESVGNALSGGLLQGILNGAAAIAVQAANMVRGAIAAARAAADAHSPSKETERLGQDLIDGLVAGLNKGGAIEAFRSQIQGIIEASYDYRTVLDHIAEVEREVADIRADSAREELFARQDIIDIVSEELRLKEELARAELGILPGRRELAGLERSFRDQQRGTLQDRLRLIDIEREIKEARLDEIGLRKSADAEKDREGPAHKALEAIRDRMQALRDEQDVIRTRNDIAASGIEKQIETARDALRPQEDKIEAIRDEIAVAGALKAVYDAQRARVTDQVNNEIALRQRLIEVFRDQAAAPAGVVAGGIQLIEQLAQQGVVTQEFAEEMRKAAEAMGVYRNERDLVTRQLKSAPASQTFQAPRVSGGGTDGERIGASIGEGISSGLLGSLDLDSIVDEQVSSAVGILASVNWSDVIVGPVEGAVGASVSVLAGLPDAATQTLEALTSAVSEQSQGVEESVSSVVKNAISAVEGARGSAESAGESLSSGIVDGVGSSIDDVGSEVQDAIDEVEDLEGDAREIGETLGEAIADGIAAGVESGATAIQEAVTSVLEGLSAPSSVRAAVVQPNAVGPAADDPIPQAGHLEYLNAEILRTQGLLAGITEKSRTAVVDLFRAEETLRQKKKATVAEAIAIANAEVAISNATNLRVAAELALLPSLRYQLGLETEIANMKRSSSVLAAAVANEEVAIAAARRGSLVVQQHEHDLRTLMMSKDAEILAIRKQQAEMVANAVPATQATIGQIASVADMDRNILYLRRDQARVQLEQLAHAQRLESLSRAAAEAERGTLATRQAAITGDLQSQRLRYEQLAIENNLAKLREGTITMSGAEIDKSLERLKVIEAENRELNLAAEARRLGGMEASAGLKLLAAEAEIAAEAGAPILESFEQQIEYQNTLKGMYEANNELLLGLLDIDVQKIEAAKEYYDVLLQQSELVREMSTRDRERALLQNREALAAAEDQIKLKQIQLDQALASIEAQRKSAEYLDLEIKQQELLIEQQRQQQEARVAGLKVEVAKKEAILAQYDADKLNLEVQLRRLEIERDAIAAAKEYYDYIAKYQFVSRPPGSPTVWWSGYDPSRHPYPLPRLPSDPMVPALAAGSFSDGWDGDYRQLSSGQLGAHSMAAFREVSGMIAERIAGEAAEAKLGQEINVIVNVHGSVVAERDLASRVRDELIRTRVINGTSGL